MVKTVAVIGAGCSGLGAVKICLEEGLEPTCFEKSDEIGGIWRYKEEVEEGITSIYKSLVSNTSKEMSCYSDFPMPDDFPNYLPNSKFLEYFKLYAEHFGLMKHIRLRTKVCSVKKQPDFLTSGQWEVVTETDGKQESAIFDAVLVCSGRYVVPALSLESFRGIKRFKGKYFHSREYKHPDGFQGKKVLVVGVGNSGVDIATEISRVAAKVFISSNRGAWVISRLSEGGYPWDIWFTTRFKTWIRLSLPLFLVNWWIERFLNKRFDTSNYGLQRDSSLWKDPLVSDDLPLCIIRGFLSVKPGVAEFAENSVTFQDGTSEDIDIVILSTGFLFTFPFLDESVVKISNNKVLLYKQVFPPELEKPTLAFIGLIQPIGSILVTSEMQARWVTRVLKGLNKLPTVEEQRKELAWRSKMITKRYGTLKGNAFQVDIIEYVDEIASEIGVKPNFFRLLLSDPRLALEVFFSCCTSPQYRLTGPGKWDGARNAIMTKWERMLKPMKTRVVKSRSRRSPLSIVLGLLCLFALFTSIFLSID
ncbi:dimethylaniline monooxygenase [N-oxide-forming] 2-like [Lissotriton helveticus]